MKSYKNLWEKGNAETKVTGFCIPLFLLVESGKIHGK